MTTGTITVNLILQEQEFCFSSGSPRLCVILAGLPFLKKYPVNHAV